MDQVIGQIHRAEKGVPGQPTIASSTGRFVQGRTSPHRANSHPTWRAAYPATEEAQESAWLCLDFNEAQNSNYERDWPFPLIYFPPGKKEIHGVPFLITDPDRNSGYNCLVSGPALKRASSPRNLPNPGVSLACRARRIYFLHLAVLQPEVARFKTRDKPRYVIRYESHQEEVVELGVYPHHTRKSGALLMDWWPNEKPVDFLPCARVAQVVSPNSLGEYERNLYSFEWLNPSPDETIHSISVRIPDDSSASFALLAVTLLK